MRRIPQGSGPGWLPQEDSQDRRKRGTGLVRLPRVYREAFLKGTAELAKERSDAEGQRSEARSHLAIKGCLGTLNNTETL